MHSPNRAWRWIRTRRTAFGSAAVALLLGTTAGCLICNDIAFYGGFEWQARADEEGAITSGSYVFDVTLDGTRFAVDCTVGATAADSGCDAPVRIEGPGGFELGISPVQGGTDFDPQAPVIGFSLGAADRTGSDPRGSYSETRGPRDVRIIALLDDTIVIDVNYQITYMRDREYRGDARCGYCDEMETRMHMIEG